MAVLLLLVRQHEDDGSSSSSSSSSGALLCRNSWLRSTRGEESQEDMGKLRTFSNNYMIHIEVWGSGIGNHGNYTKSL
ncbi:uncharacterized protein V6R79_004399 [Siganus canaliculatus]